MKKRVPGVKWKVFAYLIGFCILLIGLLWLFQITFLDRFYVWVKQSGVKKDTATIAAYLRDGEWETLVEMVRERDELYVEIWSERQGTIIVTSGDLPSAIQSRMTTWSKRMLFERIQQTGSAVERFRYNEPGLRFQGRQVEGILCAEILETEGGGQHLLMVSANLSPVRSTVETLRVQLYIISGVMLVLSAVIALLISRRISAPIVRLSASAAELGKGNYGTVFDGRGYREIAELSAALTHTAAELERTETLRRELIANVSHDLRTPLTLITGYGEMLRDLPGENSAEDIQVIIDESKRLTSLVSDLLDLSRLRPDASELRLCAFSLTECAGEIVERLARFCAKDGVTIRFERQGDVAVYADRERVSQVIYNLLANAISYVGEDRTVLIRQSVGDSRVRVEVIDCGKGIPPEELPYIWDRYYRTSESHRRSIAGAGLGLSIVRSILEAHPDMEYGVSSAEGEGSTFWFSLPVGGIR